MPKALPARRRTRAGLRRLSEGTGIELYTYVSVAERHDFVNAPGQASDMIKMEDRIAVQTVKRIFGDAGAARFIRAVGACTRKAEAKGFKLHVVLSKHRLSRLDDPLEVVDESAWDPIEEGRKAVEALKRAEGGAVDRKEAAARLDIGLAQLYNRIRQRKIVVWVDAAGRYKFPKWQFGHNGLLPGTTDCLAALGPVDEWATMFFFLSPAESAGIRSPLQLLRAGRVEEAKTLARQASHHP